MKTLVTILCFTLLAGCTRLRSHTHNDAAYQVEAVSDTAQCRAYIGAEKLRGQDGDDLKVDNPMKK
jgi:hypothetical protein